MAAAPEPAAAAAPRDRPTGAGERMSEFRRKDRSLAGFRGPRKLGGRVTSSSTKKTTAILPLVPTSTTTRPTRQKDAATGPGGGRKHGKEEEEEEEEEEEALLVVGRRGRRSQGPAIAWDYGDPYLRAFDSTAYAAMARGEFDLIIDESPANLRVQVRHEECGTPGASCATAVVAAEAGSPRIQVDARPSDATGDIGILVGGAPLPVSLDDDGGSSFFFRGENVTIRVDGEPAKKLAVLATFPSGA